MSLFHPEYMQVISVWMVDDGADAAGGASGPPEQSPGLQLCESTFSRSPQPGMIAVERLVVLGLFAVVAVGGADGGAGSLIGPVREHEDLPGQARLDDAVGSCCGSGRGCVPVSRARTRAGFRPAVR